MTVIVGFVNMPTERASEVCLTAEARQELVNVFRAKLATLEARLAEKKRELAHPAERAFGDDGDRGNWTDERDRLVREIDQLANIQLPPVRRVLAALGMTWNATCLTCGDDITNRLLAGFPSQHCAECKSKSERR